MRDFITAIQYVIAGIGGYIGYYLGGWDGFLIALVGFVVLDFITGVMAAIIEKKLSSEVGYRGIFKKVLVFVLVAIANIIDTQLIQNGSAVRTAVIFFYIYNEGISILENVARIGLPVPDKLKDILAQIGGSDDPTDKEGF